MAAPTLTTFDHAVQALKDVVNADPTKVGSKKLMQDINAVAARLAQFSAVDLSAADLSVVLGDAISDNQLTTV